MENKEYTFEQFQEDVQKSKTGERSSESYEKRLEEITKEEFVSFLNILLEFQTTREEIEKKDISEEEKKKLLEKHIEPFRTKSLMEKLIPFNLFLRIKAGKEEFSALTRKQ